MNKIEEYLGSKITEIFLGLIKKYPEDFKIEIWDKILGFDLSISQKQSKEILEWCLKKLKDEKNKGSE